MPFDPTNPQSFNMTKSAQGLAGMPMRQMEPAPASNVPRLPGIGGGVPVSRVRRPGGIAGLAGGQPGAVPPPDPNSQALRKMQMRKAMTMRPPVSEDLGGAQFMGAPGGIAELKGTPGGVPVSRPRPVAPPVQPAPPQAAPAAPVPARQPRMRQAAGRNFR